MITLNPIPQAIIEVVSCEFKTKCCIGGVNTIKYNCIAHSPAKRENNTIRNTSNVSNFLNGWIIDLNAWSWIFCIKDTNNVDKVACITMDSWKMRSSSEKTTKTTRMICLKQYQSYNFLDQFDLSNPKKWPTINKIYDIFVTSYIKNICNWGTQWKPLNQCRLHYSL